MKNIRQPIARHFYAGDCRQQIIDFLIDMPASMDLPPNPIGAVIPHAGWSYSGAIAARTLQYLSRMNQPETVIIFGTDHTGVSQHCTYPSGAWLTPLGKLLIDEKLNDAIISTMSDLVVDAPAAHGGEHSIEVITPMIKYFWPETKFLPITVKSDLSSIELGRRLAKLMFKRNDYLALASTDLTHYGAVYGFAPAGTGVAGYRWMQENDNKMINAIISESPEKVIQESIRNHNACGSGAVAALKAFTVNVDHNRGYLLEYLTSHGHQPEELFEYGVGYVGIVF